MMNYNYNGMNMNAGWAIFCTLFVVAIIALIVWAIMRSSGPRGLRNSQGGQGGQDGQGVLRNDALSTLERRFASGEIDDSEYQRRRALLAQH